MASAHGALLCLLRCASGSRSRVFSLDYLFPRLPAALLCSWLAGLSRLLLLISHCAVSHSSLRTVVAQLTFALHPLPCGHPSRLSVDTPGTSARVQELEEALKSMQTRERESRALFGEWQARCPCILILYMILLVIFVIFNVFCGD